MSASSAPHFRQLKTPRAAALAGVLFALLFGAVILLIGLRMPQGMKDSSAWLSANHGGIVTATVLMPFAGISFLWFIGVVRDGFGHYEDRFFASVFLGSGILFLAMMFVATAVAAGMASTNADVLDAAAHAEVIALGKGIVLATTKTYALRMAAVFMISAATIWLKTGLMAKWLAALTYLVALVILAATDLSLWVTMAFPIWVLLISGLYLTKAGVLNLDSEKPATT